MRLTPESYIVWRRSVRKIIGKFVGHWLECWSANTLATWYKELTLWKRPWCWERLKAEGEKGDRRWEVWMASPIQWKELGQTLEVGERQGNLVCYIQSMGSWRVGHHLVTEQQTVSHIYLFIMLPSWWIGGNLKAEYILVTIVSPVPGTMSGMWQIVNTYLLEEWLKLI